jgi:hypothetical protein
MKAFALGEGTGARLSSAQAAEPVGSSRVARIAKLLLLFQQCVDDKA